MLYHFSEESSIRRFVPRVPMAHPEVEPMVWAIDREHQYVYWLPRDCPRIAFWPVPETTPDDLSRFWTGVTGRMVIAFEAMWLERLQTIQIYRYSLPPETFTPKEDWGVFVSHSTVEPIAAEPMGNLLDALATAPIELRICPLLVPLSRAIIDTSFNWHVWT